MKKKERILTIVCIILAVISLVLGGYIIYDKVNDSNATQDISSLDVGNNIDESKEKQFTSLEADLIKHANGVKAINFDFADYVIHAEGEYDESRDKINILFEVDNNQKIAEELRQKLYENIGPVPIGYHFESELDDDPDVEILGKYTTITSGKILMTIHVSGILYIQNSKIYLHFLVR